MNVFADVTPRVAREFSGRCGLRRWCIRALSDEEPGHEVERAVYPRDPSIFAGGSYENVGLAVTRRSWPGNFGWRRGNARQLLAHVDAQARSEGTPSLSADVSITARPFFERHGRTVEAEQHPVKAGVELTNYKMQRELRYRATAFQRGPGVSLIPPWGKRPPAAGGHWRSSVDGPWATVGDR